jgi:RNA-directed DNA polymerase
MRQKIGELNIRRTTCRELVEIAQKLNPILQGWLNYYGAYTPAAMHPIWKHVNSTLVTWAMRKYKRFKGRKIQAAQMISAVAIKRRKLFVHWQLGVIGTAA